MTRTLRQTLVTLMLAATVVGAPTPASARPDVTGPGTRDTTFGTDGALRIPVPAGTRAHRVIAGADGGWWLLARAPHGALLARSDERGAVRALGATDLVTIPHANPVALDVGPSGAARVLLRSAGGDLSVAQVSEDGAVMTRPIEGGRPDHVWRDAAWTEAGIVVVGSTADDPNQPLIGIVQHGRLRWTSPQAAGTWGRLNAVAQGGPAQFVATGAGGYPESGLRGYPLMSFGPDLQMTPGAEGGVLVDPRENCQFAMAGVVATAIFNTVVGTTWGCDEFPVTFSAVVAQQHPSLQSHEAFGGINGHAGEGAVRIMPAPGLNWHGAAVAVDSVGRIVVAGTAISTAAGSAWPGSPDLSTPRPLSARLLPSGDTDFTFALNDLALVNSRWAWTIADVAVDAADRPLLFGTATSAGRTQLRLVRLLG